MGDRCTDCTFTEMLAEATALQTKPFSQTLSLAPDCRRQQFRRHAAGAVVAHVSSSSILIH